MPSSSKTVEIIFPSTPPLSQEHLDTAKAILESYGLNVIYQPDAYDSTKAPYQYYAHTLDKRVENFIQALEGPADILWAFRGGYGCNEIIDRLEALGYVPPSTPKTIVGFSDITHLHGLATKWSWPSLHAVNAGLGTELYEITKASASKDTSLRSVVDILLGNKPSLEYTFEVLYNPLSTETLSGTIVGGNATLAREMQGTPTALPTAGNFIFLEDSKEDPKRLSRVFVSLLRSGFFDRAKAILFGHLPMEEEVPEEKEFARSIIRLFIEDHLKTHKLNVPVLYSSDFGHGERNEALPLGTPATLHLKDKEGILRVSWQ